MNTLRTLLALTLTLTVTTTAAARQDPPTTPPVTPPTPPTGESGSPPADGASVVPETFDSLQKSFDELRDKIRKGEVTPVAGRTQILDLRRQVSSFNALRTPTEKSLAVELQLITWANEFGQPQDDLFGRFDKIDPQHPGLRVHWAEYLKRKYQYTRAVEVLDAVDIDLKSFPQAAVVRAECLLPDNGFDQAEQTLASIPEGADPRGLLFDRIDTIRRQIDDVRTKWEEEKSILAQEAQADDLPRVIISTVKGDIILELFENHAPNTVANFVSLVEKNFYDGVTFHRVVPNFVVQGGDPVTKEGGAGVPGTGGPGYRIRDEMPAGSYRRHFGGYLSMANSGPDTNGSQFFITLNQRFDLDGRHTVFGRVIDGMRVVRQIEINDRITSARVLRKRDHEYVPETLPEPPPPAPPTPPGGGEGEGHGDGGAGGNDGSGGAGDG